MAVNGLLLSIPLLLVARLFGTNPGLGLYELSRDILPWLLLAISVFLILTETTRLAWPSWVQASTKWARLPLPKPKEFTFHIGKWRIYRRIEAIDFRLGDNSRAAGMLVVTAFFLLAGFYGWPCSNCPDEVPLACPLPLCSCPHWPDYSALQI